MASRACTCASAMMSSAERTAVPATPAAAKRASTAAWSCRAIQEPTSSSEATRFCRRAAGVAKRGSFGASGASIAAQRRAKGWSPAPETAIHPPSRVR